MILISKTAEKLRSHWSCLKAMKYGSGIYEEEIAKKIADEIFAKMESNRFEILFFQQIKDEDLKSRIDYSEG